MREFFINISYWIPQWEKDGKYKTNNNLEYIYTKSKEYFDDLISMTSFRICDIASDNQIFQK
jgi:hypothetical protein